MYLNILRMLHEKINSDTGTVVNALLKTPSRFI